MHLNQIQSFLSVSKLLNFTNAARQNGVPQSTISRHINDLENQLGVKLFYRTKRNVSLTEEGRTFIPYAQEILDAARKGAYAVKQLHDGASGHLSVATIPAADRFLKKCLELFISRYPDIVVDITYTAGGESLLDSTDDPYDFHFLYTDLLPDNDLFEVMDIEPDMLNLVFSRRVYDEDRIDISRLKKEKFILLSEQENPILYMQIMNFCRTHRFSPNIINQFSDIRPLLLSVSAGLGVSIIPAFSTEGLSTEDLSMIPLDESYSIDCTVAWKRSLLNPASSLFLDVIRESCR